MQKIHLRVVDAASNQPTAVRVRITDPQKTVYFPFGSHHQFPVGRNEDVGGRVRVQGEEWVYMDGQAEILLPHGTPLRIRILKGLEYRPVDEVVTLSAGQMALRFSIERCLDVQSAGWFASDPRCHFIPPHAAVLEAKAEGLNLVQLLAIETAIPSLDGNTYASAPHIHGFSGQDVALVSNTAKLAINTCNYHPVLGKVSLLHAHRIIYPLMFGGTDYSDDWSLCDWCDQCHRKGGLTVWSDVPEPAHGGEALIALILGKIDALEIHFLHKKAPILPFIYQLYNAGCTVPLVGASAKDSNRHVLGMPRTYVQLPANTDLTLANWVAAIKAGRCYVTNGPLLDYSVTGNGPYHIQAIATSITAFERLELVENGVVTTSQTATLTDQKWTARIDMIYQPQGPTWLALRVLGTSSTNLNPEQPVFAHTSPILFSQTPEARSRAIRSLQDMVKKTTEWVRDQGRFTDDKYRMRLLTYCQQAEDTLSRRLGSDELQPAK